MAIDYTFQWSDPTTKPSFIVSAGTLDSTTSLNLNGSGSLNWGQDVQQNLLYILENFAGPTAPVRATLGQSWFNTTTSSLHLNTSNTIPAWGELAFVSDVVSNTNASLNFAPINGSSGNLFSVASPPQNGSNAISYSFADGRYARVNGSSLNQFAVATATASDTAVPYQQARLLYGTVNNLVAIANGGTGAITKEAAITNLIPGAITPGHILRTGGPGVYYWSQEQSIPLSTIITTTRLLVVSSANQTVFTTPSYTVGLGQLRAYVDGVRQFDNQYTETSPTSITFNAPGIPLSSEVLFEVDGYATVGSATATAAGTLFVASGTITSVNVQDAIQTLDNLKAPINNAILTGIPTAPTAALGNSTSQIATTSFAMTNIVNKIYEKTLGYGAFTSFSLGLGPISTHRNNNNAVTPAIFLNSTGRAITVYIQFQSGGVVGFIAANNNVGSSFSASTVYGMQSANNNTASCISFIVPANFYYAVWWNGNVTSWKEV